jgi:hypothetical protein
MRRLIVVFAIVLTFASVAVGADAASTLSRAGASTPRVYRDCGDRPPIRGPYRIVIACGDGNALFRDLSWRRWDAYVAKGHGLFTANDCKPNCAEGTFHSYRVRVKLTRVWRTDGYRVFHRIGYEFTGSHKPRWLPWRGHFRLPTPF